MAEEQSLSCNITSADYRGTLVYRCVVEGKGHSPPGFGETEKQAVKHCRNRCHEAGLTECVHYLEEKIFPRYERPETPEEFADFLEEIGLKDTYGPRGGVLVSAAKMMRKLRKRILELEVHGE